MNTSEVENYTVCKTQVHVVALTLTVSSELHIETLGARFLLSLPIPYSFV